MTTIVVMTVAGVIAATTVTAIQVVAMPTGIASTSTNIAITTIDHWL
jgi:hypothetical protein